MGRLLGRTLDELEDMTPGELATWAAYYTLEPWGYEIDNFRSALIAYSARVDAWGSKGKRFPGKLEDFMRQSPIGKLAAGGPEPNQVLAAFGLRYPDA